MQLIEANPVMLWTHIKCSELSEYFQGQWSEHLSLQKSGLLTDITLYLKDGSISLHQAVLVPLSSVLSHSSCSATPLAILLPDYDLSTAQCLVSLLYSGRCLPQSTASYFSLLAMISSMGINLSPSSLALCSPEHYKYKQGHVGLPVKAVPDFPSKTFDDNLLGGSNSAVLDGTSHEENYSQAQVNDILSTEENNNELEFNCIKDKGFSEDAKTSVTVICSDCGVVSCLCTGIADLNSLGITDRIEAGERTGFKKNLENILDTQISEQPKIPKFNLKYRGTTIGDEPTPSVQGCVNTCPVCGVELAGGMFKYRAHLVEKHFYKQLSAMVGTGVKQCPVCEKTMKMRSNLVKHFGIVHKYVDQLLSDDINQNSTIICDEDLEDPPKLVIDDDRNEEEEAPSSDTLVPHLSNPPSKFTCTLCRCSRKSQFRLLQHYSVAHFRTNLEEKFGLQFVTNNGCCPFCKKIMKNLYSFIVHIGAAHGEVSQYVKDQYHEHEGSLEKASTLKTWLCPSETCSNAKFSNKCFLMKHLAIKHYNEQLSAILQPLYETSRSCEACGKKFSNYQRFLIHCSVTHRMVLPYCSQMEMESLKDQVGRVRRLEGDKTFECKLCKKAFMNKYLLKKHYTAKHFYDALIADFAASVSSGVCQKCGKEHEGSRMVQHLGVTHDEVVSYVEGLSTDVPEPEVILHCD